MRISDWSSDVCSSDLLAGLDRLHRLPLHVVLAALLQVAEVPVLVLPRGNEAQGEGLARKTAGIPVQRREADEELLAVAAAEHLRGQRPLSALLQLLDRKSTRLNSSH